MKLFLALFNTFGTACWVYIIFKEVLPLWVTIPLMIMSGAGAVVNFHEYFKKQK